MGSGIGSRLSQCTVAECFTDDEFDLYEQLATGELSGEGLLFSELYTVQFSRQLFVAAVRAVGDATHGTAVCTVVSNFSLCETCDLT